MNRGAPLPMSTRLEIKSMVQLMPIKLVARVLGVSKNTVKKYAGETKFDPRRRNSA